MCHITATELKNNLGHYLELSSKEDVFITKNGKVIALLTDPHERAFIETLKFIDEVQPLKDKNLDNDDDLLYEALKEKYGITN